MVGHHSIILSARAHAKTSYSSAIKANLATCIRAQISLPQAGRFKQLLVQLPNAVERPAHAPVFIRHSRVNVCKDKIFLVTAAAHDDLAERVHDVAVAIAHAVEARDGGIFAEN